MMQNATGTLAARQGLATKVMCIFAALLMLGVWGVSGNAGAATTPPPPAPTGLSPNGTSTTSNPTLSWNAVSGATSYRVIVKSTPDGKTVVNNTTVYSNNFVIAAELPVSKYNWTVTPYNGSTAGTSVSSTFEKTLVAGPTLISPVNGTVLNYPEDNPAFVWDPVTGVKTYTLLVSTDPNFVPASTMTYTTQATSYSLTTAQQFGQTYYWSVQGQFSATNVNTAVSAVGQYSIGWGGTGLVTPTLLSPSNSITNSVHDVVLKWAPVPGAATYEVEVSPNADWTNNLTFDVVTDSTLYAPAKNLDNATYYWRVRATTNRASQSNWSEQWQFRRVPMGQVQLKSPTTGAVGSPAQISDLFLSWDPVPEASAYELELSTDPNFSVVSTSQVCITNHTDWAPYTNEGGTGLRAVGGPGGTGACPLNRTSLSNLFPSGSDGVTLYWRVRGLDNFKTSDLPDPWGNSPANQPLNGPWSNTGSSPWSFQYRADLGVPTLTSPADNASVTVPRLTWSAVEGAQTYVVTLNGHQYTTSATSFVAPTAVGATNTWTVQSKNYLGLTSPLPSLRTFTYSAPTPTATTITPSAAQDPATTSGTVSFQWAPVTNATKYEVLWFTGGGSTYTTLASPIYPAFTMTTGQQAGFSNYRIVAYNVTGSVTTQVAISAPRSITIGVPDVSLDSPVNCAPTTTSCTAEASTPVLKWHPIAGASYYRVILALDHGFTNKVRQYLTAEPEIRPVEALPDNQAGSAYYWFVQACNGTGNAMICGSNVTAAGVQIRAFQKRSAPITGAKTLGTPKPTDTTDACAGSGVTTFSDQPTFCWDAYGGTSANDVSAMTYHVQVSTTSNFAAGTIVDDAEVDQASYTPYKPGSSPTSIRHLTYPDAQLYWRVQARDATGNYLTWSPTQTPVKSSGTVTQLLPENAANVNMSPPLSWTAKNFAAQYTVEVYKNGDTNWSPTNLVRSQLTDLTSFTATQGGNPNQSLPAGLYAWRVRAIDANGLAGAWSAGSTFNVNPGVPGLTTPTKNAKIGSNTVLFTWTAVPGAVEYSITASIHLNLSSPIINNQKTVTTEWAPTSQIPNDTIYWQVQALDGQGKVIGTSSLGQFMFNMSSPTATKPIASSITSRGVHLAWTPSPNPVNGSITKSVITVYVGNTVNRLVTVNGAGTSVTVTGLSPSTSYGFTVTPYDRSGAGIESGKTTAKTLVGNSSAQSYVYATYKDFLNATPSSGQLAAAVARLNMSNPTTLSNYVASLSNSTYWVNNIVTQFYLGTLGRVPDPSGLAFWTNRIRTRQVSVAGAAASFYSSSEYFNNSGGTLTGWVTDLYTALLQRPLDPGGLAYWIRAAQAGPTAQTGRTNVAYSFYQSLESRKVRVANLYLSLLGRTPDSSGQLFWAGKILIEGDIALARNLAISSEYVRRAAARFP